MSKRPAKKSEHARIFPFSFAPLTLNVKHGREIVPDRTPAEQPRGPRPHGLRHGAKPLKREQVMSAKDEGESDNVGGLPTEFRFDESPVRAVVQDDEPWFVAKDVCDILGIDNPSQAVGRLDDDEKGITNTYTTAGLREMLTVNEFRRLQPRLHQPETGGQALPQMGHERGLTRNPQDRRISSSGDPVRRPLGRAGRIRALASGAGAPRR